MSTIRWRMDAAPRGRDQERGGATCQQRRPRRNRPRRRRKVSPELLRAAGHLPSAGSRPGILSQRSAARPTGQVRGSSRERNEEKGRESNYVLHLGYFSTARLLLSVLRPWGLLSLRGVAASFHAPGERSWHTVLAAPHHAKEYGHRVRILPRGQYLLGVKRMEL